MNRTIERFYPFIISIAAGYIAFHLRLNFEQLKISNQLSAGINISAILMGFLGTAKAMLLGYSSKKFNEIKKHEKYWTILLSYFQASLLANITLCIYSIILFSLDNSITEKQITENLTIGNFLLPIWIFLTFVSFLTFFRVLKIIFTLLKRS